MAHEFLRLVRIATPRLISYPGPCTCFPKFFPGHFDKIREKTCLPRLSALQSPRSAAVPGRSNVTTKKNSRLPANIRMEKTQPVLGLVADCQVRDLQVASPSTHPAAYIGIEHS
jgi:hypothetical protein